MHSNIFKEQGKVFKLKTGFQAGTVQVKPNKRLTLITSDPRISAALFILSISKMILIYLNYKLWLIQWKIIHTKILDTVVLDRNELDGFFYYKL